LSKVALRLSYNKVYTRNLS